MITPEKAKEIATKEALKLGYDEARFVKKEGETSVFVCSFNKEDQNDLPVGLPLFIEISEKGVNLYSGFKYLK